jgi:hypothetical protein
MILRYDNSKLCGKVWLLVPTIFSRWIATEAETVIGASIQASANYFPSAFWTFCQNYLYTPRVEKIGESQIIPTVATETLLRAGLTAPNVGTTIGAVEGSPVYVHTICSGSKKQYRKRLLRVGRRDGYRVLNCTIANLTGWTDDQIQRLQEVLEEKRASKGAASKNEADRSILGLLLAGGLEPWRLIQEWSPR